MSTYNGWKNYETWNQSLWLLNEEGFYRVALQCKDFPDFVLRLKESGVDQTPDGIWWGTKGTDIDALNKVINALKN